MMIKSCKDCKTPCCQVGPGPYKLVTPEEFLDNFGDTESYNTKCMALEKGRCRLWNTSEFPIACRTYICQNREFTQEELKKIDNITDEHECSECGCPYILQEPDGAFNWRDTCEVCGNTYLWVKTDEKE